MTLRFIHGMALAVFCVASLWALMGLAVWWLI